MIAVEATDQLTKGASNPFADAAQSIADANNPVQLLKYFSRHPEGVRKNMELCVRVFQRISKADFQRSEVLLKTQELFQRIPELAKASCDAQIQVGNQSVPLHRHLVEAQCPVLDEKLRNEDTDWADFPLFLSDVSSAPIEHVLELLESGTTTFHNPEAVLQTLQQGAALELERVATACEMVLARLLSRDNALTMWQFALSTRRPTLVLRVGEFIRTKMSLETHVKWTSAGDIESQSIAQEYLALNARGVTFAASPEHAIQVKFYIKSSEVMTRTIKFLGNIGTKSIDLSDNNLTALRIATIVNTLVNLPLVEALDLSRNPLGSKGATPLSMLLNKAVHLQSLRLSGCQLESSGINGIAHALGKNNTLRRLDLSHNGLEKAGAKGLASALKDNATLRELDFSGNAIGAKGVKHLVEGVIKGQHVERLTVRYCKLGDHTHSLLTDLLRKVPSLQTLDLGFCGIGDDALKSLGKGLSENRSLRSLILSGNGFTGSGVKDFLQFLADSPPLSELDLSENDLGDIGFRALGEFLKSNKRLEVLKLCGVNGQWDGKIGCGVRSLSEGLKDNDTLRVLDLSLTRPMMQGFTTLLEGLKENNGLEHLILLNTNLQETERLSVNVEDGPSPVEQELSRIRQFLQDLALRGGAQVWW